MDSHPDEHPFSLCLTHDVDRVYQTFQGPYDAVRTRSVEPLRASIRELLRAVTVDQRHTSVADPRRGSTDHRCPYWQFESVMALEAELGIRSSWYFLDEQRLLGDRPVRDWLDPRSWLLYTGRYDVRDPAIADVITDLDRGGWEVGLHGSYESGDDVDRLAYEVATLEGVLGSAIRGGRQHYLRATVPETWEHYREIGLRYDASLGSRTTYGFGGLYDVVRPFDDDFVVFPLTVMDTTLFGTTPSTEAAWRECRRLLDQARANDAVMTVCWHQRHFNEERFPGVRAVYERLVREAQAMGAWVGPPGRWYDHVVGGAERGSAVTQRPLVSEERWERE